MLRTVPMETAISGSDALPGVKYRTKDGDRKMSKSYLISLFPRVPPYRRHRVLMLAAMGRWPATITDAVLTRQA
jgi:hypothetical protein